ncbi:MAG: hypothetical protein PUE64_11145 [Firmicutes bacterium]|jgi:hypothetical protein|nr:hypothetical protein [Bacillota bacterium]
MYRSALFLTLGILLGISILSSLVLSWIRKKDFADQVSGKKPERKADPKTRISYDRPQQENSQIAIDREILRTRGGQNLLGPK